MPSGVFVACHKCEECRDQKINDWVGRNIAESKTSAASYAGTLTYGRNKIGEALHERAVIKTYSDIQNWLKLLRRHGYNVRYFITGEFGELNGRVHWHAIMHFKDKRPDWKLNQMIWTPEWAQYEGNRGNRKFVDYWGHQVWKPINYRSVKYACKYILKNVEGESSQAESARLSKKPPLGTEYFQRLARRYAEQGLAPQSLEYSFKEHTYVDKKDGLTKPWRFCLKDRPAEMYLQAYIDAWRELHGPTSWWPNSQVVDLFYEYGRIVWDEDQLQRRDERVDGPLRIEPDHKRKAPYTGPRNIEEWQETYEREQANVQKGQRPGYRERIEPQHDEHVFVYWRERGRFNQTS